MAQSPGPLPPGVELTKEVRPAWARQWGREGRAPRAIGACSAARVAAAPLPPKRTLLIFAPPPPAALRARSQETDKLSRAFDDPTFRRMLMEYAADITDPKVRAAEGPRFERTQQRAVQRTAHACSPRRALTLSAAPPPPQAREENEAYLRQLEGEGRAEEVYGAGSQLVAPSPALVVKTRLKAAAGGDGGGSDGASGGGAKVFINICTSDKVRPGAAGAGHLHACQWHAWGTCMLACMHASRHAQAAC